MATTSTIPTVKAALITTLAARAGLSGVHVVYAWDGQAMAAESIYLDPPTRPEHTTSNIPVMTAARKKREEDYRITVVIQVAQEAATAATGSTTEARAFALLAELENCLADDPTLAAAGGLTTRITIAGYDRLLTPSQNGWTARLDVELSVQVRLS